MTTFTNFRIALSLPFISSVVYLMSLATGCVNAQPIVPDNTLSGHGFTDSVVNTNGTIHTITGGTPQQGNLFHSFTLFSLPLNHTAFFDNVATIQNIITRVTGGQISDINGLIRANGTANLFLINPSGIIFGPNASLDIGGSFVASTANSILFNDGIFSARDPANGTLLSINVPLGVQMGTNPGNIIIRGSGNGLTVNPRNFEIIRAFRPAGLAVNPGQTLTLIGGNIQLDGGNITATQGRINLGSFSNGQVNFTNNNGQIQLTPISGINYGNIQFLRASSADVSGNASGNIQVLGRNLILTNGSVILADTLGNGTGGEVNVTTTESIQVTGVKPPFVPPFGLAIFSGIFTEVASSSANSAQGGNITLETGQLIVANGGQIGVNTFGAGQAGKLNITANNILLTGESPLGPSGLFIAVAPNATGEGGTLTLTANQLQMNTGAQISGSTYSSGNARTALIKVGQIDISGNASNGFPTAILMNVEQNATGQGGSLLLETDTLKLSNGGQIANQNFGSGTAGSLTIKANTINLIGSSQFAPSGIFSQVGRFNPAPTGDSTTGNGGNIQVQTNQLNITDGAAISASTAAVGNSGTVTIKAQNIQIKGGTAQGASGIFSTVIPNAQGQGGQVTLETDTLQITNGGQIAVSTAGFGRGGSLSVNAQSVELTGGSTFGSSGLFANAIIGEGQGGNVNLNTTQLTVENGATINVGNFPSRISNNLPGKGAPGNLNIQAQSVILNNQGSLNAETLAGSQGNINLSSATIRLQGNSKISTNAQGTGSGGSISLNTNNLALDNSIISSNAPGQGSAGNINVNALNNIPNITLTESTISALGNQGNLNLNGNNISLNRGSSLTTEGNQGNITVNTANLQLNQASRINSNAIGNNSGGSISLNTNNLALDNSIISSNAPGQGSAGNVSINSFIENPNITLTESTISALGNQGNLNLNGNNISLNQGSILTTEGNQGNIIVNTRNLQLNQSSRINSNAIGNNSGGSISLNTNNLALDNSIISSNAPGQGSAGNVSINSFIENPNITLTESTISALGNQGNLNLNGENIALNQGSSLTTEGNQGNITVNSVNLQLNQASRINSNAIGNNSGGSISLNTNNLTLDNSIISSNAPGQGSAGNINVNAFNNNPNITLTESTISATGNQGNLNLNGENIALNQGSSLTTEGNQGNITVNSVNLQLNQASRISTNAIGDNSGGNMILITDNAIIIKENSSVTTDAQGNGSGGNIQILTGTILIEAGSQISANASAGSGGSVLITATSPRTLRLNQGKITATGGEGNIILNSPIIFLRNGSLISTNGLGNTAGGNIIINADFIFAVPTENSDITANAQQAAGGRVIISTRGIFGVEVRKTLTPLSDITVSSDLGPAFSGIVIIRNLDGDPTDGFVTMPSDVIDASDRIVSGCAADSGNVFAFTGQGGVPNNPSQVFSGQTSWQDLRALSEQNQAPQANNIIPIQTQLPPDSYCYQKSLPYPSILR